MSIYSNKLAHVQVVINCRYSVAQMCTREDTLICVSIFHPRADATSFQSQVGDTRPTGEPLSCRQK